MDLVNFLQESVVSANAGGFEHSLFLIRRYNYPKRLPTTGSWVFCFWDGYETRRHINQQSKLILYTITSVQVRKVTNAEK